jgi:hypothetical protein
VAKSPKLVRVLQLAAECILTPRASSALATSTKQARPSRLSLRLLFTSRRLNRGTLALNSASASATRLQGPVVPELGGEVPTAGCREQGFAVAHHPSHAMSTVRAWPSHMLPDLCLFLSPNRVRTPWPSSTLTRLRERQWTKPPKNAFILTIRPNHAQPKAGACLRERRSGCRSSCSSSAAGRRQETPRPTSKSQFTPAWARQSRSNKQ